MVSWSADGTLSGYDSVTRQWKQNAFFFASPGVVNLNGVTRLGVALASSFSQTTYPNRLIATAPLTISSGDASSHPGARFGAFMFVANANNWPEGTIPTVKEIRTAAFANGTVTPSTTYRTSAGTSTFAMPGPRPQQGGRYWVAVIPAILVYAGGSILYAQIDPFDSNEANTLGRALSIYTNRTPGKPTITSPPTGQIVAPGDDFDLTYAPSDPDALGTDDADRINRDLAGVEFQYAPVPTAENPNPTWLPFSFAPTSGAPYRRSWEIKQTYGAAGEGFDVNEFAYLRKNMSANVIAGLDPDPSSGPVLFGKGALPVGDWQIRCRTFDYGHPYPLIARPGNGASGSGAGGLNPSNYPAINTSPWSDAVQVSVPSQVPPPVPVSPKDNVAVGFGTTPRLLWQYRNTFVPPFDQYRRTVQIRKFLDPDWTTIFDGVSGNSYVDLPASYPGDPGSTYEYMEDGGFEDGGLDGWAASWIVFPGPPSPMPTLTNVNNPANAHSGDRYLDFSGTDEFMYNVAKKRVTLRPQDETFEFEAWVYANDANDYITVTFDWLDDANGAVGARQSVGFAQKLPGASWGGYVHIQSRVDIYDPGSSGLIPRRAGASKVDVSVFVNNDTLDEPQLFRLDDVSLVGHAPTGGEPFELELSTRYEWRVKTMDSDGEESDYSLPARFWIVPNPGTGDERPIIAENIEGATLGCGTHTVEVYRRGGVERVGVLKNVSYVDYSRVRDDKSDAKVIVSDWDIDCGNLLAKLQCWAYEIVIWRDNGFTKDRVWEGPITLLTYKDDSVEINAQDVIAYLYRRIIKIKMSDTGAGATVVDRARRVIQNAFAPDDPNVLAWMRIISSAEDARQYRTTPAYARTAYEEVDDMAANAGLDYTAIGRSILLWGTKRRIGTLPEFRDKDLGAAPIVSEYGMSMANRYVVSDGNGNWGEATRLDEAEQDETYGLVEMLSSTWASDAEVDTGTYTQAGLQTMIQSFEQFAERSISDRYPNPVVVRVPDNTTVNPSAVISINQLVPGVVIPLRSNSTLRTVVGNQKLDSVKVVESDGKETITVTMSAFNRDDSSIDDGGAGGGDGGGGSGLVELDAIAPFTDNSSDATVVGGSGALADDSDETYVESEEGQFSYTFALTPLGAGLYQPGGSINLHIRLSVSGNGGSPGSGEVFIATDDEGIDEIGGFSDGSGSGYAFPIPLVDGTIQDLVIPLRMTSWPGTTADIVAALEAGAYLDFNNISNPGWLTTPIVRVYKASVVVNVDGETE